MDEKTIEELLEETPPLKKSMSNRICDCLSNIISEFGEYYLKEREFERNGELYKRYIMPSLQKSISKRFFGVYRKLREIFDSYSSPGYVPIENDSVETEFKKLEYIKKSRESFIDASKVIESAFLVAGLSLFIRSGYDFYNDNNQGFLLSLIANFSIVPYTIISLRYYRLKEKYKQKKELEKNKND